MNAEIRFKDKRILEALEYIDEKYIDDVFDVLKEPDMTQNVRVKLSPFRHWKQYLALAACLILLAFATPIFGYVAEFIGSFAAGIGDHTSGITENSDLGEETFNDIESTENEQTTEEAIPNFQYSNVKIITDNNTSINPVSVHIGYTWYKDEKSVWTEKIASGWQYVINTEKYKYENFPHLTLDRVISYTLPENVTVSHFEIYATDWVKTEYSFDKLSELSMLPAGDYIIVGIEKERIPYEKPHYVVGEYDYKLDESAIIFALTVTKDGEEITSEEVIEKDDSIPEAWRNSPVFSFIAEMTPEQIFEEVLKGGWVVEGTNADGFFAGAELWHVFCDKVNRGVRASVLIANYSIGNYHLETDGNDKLYNHFIYLTEIIYDGKIYKFIKYDPMNHTVLETGEYKYLITDIFEYQSITDRGRMETYFLTNDNTWTYREYLRGELTGSPIYTNERVFERDCRLIIHHTIHYDDSESLPSGNYPFYDMTVMPINNKPN